MNKKDKKDKKDIKDNIKSNDDRSLKNGTITAISALLAAIIVALSLTLVGLLPASVRKIDLSGKRVTELSDEAKDYIDRIDTDVSIYLVSEVGNEDTVIMSFLERVSERSDSITLSTADPVLEPTLITKYSDTSLEDNSLIITSEKRSKVIGCYDLYTFSVTDESAGKELGVYRYEDFYTLLQNYSAYFTAGYYSYTQEFDGENVLLSAIDYVTTDTLPTAYALSGHGEAAIEGGLLSALSLDNVDMKSLILTSDSKNLLADAGCIIINSPTSDISENELAILREYISSKGSIILTTSPDAVQFKNLMSLTADFGLSGKCGYVYEENAENYFGYKDMLLPDCASASAYLNLGSYAAALVTAHPIIISDEELSGISYVTLFKTSQSSRFKSSEDSEDLEDDSENENTEDPSGSYTLGVVASDANSSLVWISSSYFTQSSVNSYVNGGNNIFFVAVCEKLCGKIRSLSIESKAMVEDSLVINSAQAIFWSGILVGIIPLGVILIGVFVTLRRRKRGSRGA